MTCYLPVLTYLALVVGAERPLQSPPECRRVSAPLSQRPSELRLCLLAQVPKAKDGGRGGGLGGRDRDLELVLAIAVAAQDREHSCLLQEQRVRRLQHAQLHRPRACLEPVSVYVCEYVCICVCVYMYVCMCRAPASSQ